MKYILSIIAVSLIGISIFSCSSQIKIANQDKVDQLLKQLNNSVLGCSFYFSDFTHGIINLKDSSTQGIYTNRNMPDYLFS